MAYIYQITNNINGKIYVGKTVKNNIQERWKEHLKDYKKPRCEKRPLYDAMNKYGSENFSIKELEECSLEELNDKEIYWIEKLGSFKYGYNATIDGDGKQYIDYDLVCETYKNLKSVKNTAKQLGISEDSVSRILKIYNIEILPGALSQGKMINQFDLQGNYIQTFINGTEAGKSINKSNTHIMACANGKRKTAYGYIWKFVNKENRAVE